MKSTFFSILLFFVLILPVAGQTSPVLTRAILIDGDTVPIYVMNQVKIFGPIIFQNKTDAIRFTRLVRNVKKVYPYAKITGIKVKEFDEIIKNAKNEKDRKEKMKAAEDELKAQFEDDVKNMTFKQGVLLIKLIDRETGNSSFELIKEFRGRFMASFYQTIGRLFGYNLKTTYDPEGEDKEVEKIVQMIENGAI